MNREEQKNFQKSNKEHIENNSFILDIKYLKEQESKGFYLAKAMMTAFLKFEKIKELFENYKEGMGLEDEILSIAADVFYLSVFCGITKDFQAKSLYLANKVIIKKNKEEPSFLDRNARIVKLGLLLFQSSPDALAFCEECLLKYPDVPYFSKIKITLFMLIGKNEQGVRIGKEAVRKWPENMDIAFMYAIHYQSVIKIGSTNTEKLEEVKRLFNIFIDLAPKDHPKIPDAYYFIAKSHVDYAFKLLKLTKMSKSKEPRSHEYEVMLLENVRETRKYYEKGVEAEGLQLPRYELQESPVKEDIELYFKTMKTTFGFNESGQMFKVGLGDKSVKIFKEHRTSIKAHRESQNLNVQFEKKCGLNKKASENEPELKQNSPHPSTKGYKSTLIPIIEKKWNHIYKGFYIEFTIVDDPDVNFETKEIGLLVQDNINFLLKVVIDGMKNIENVEYIEKYFGFGCKIVISDPFYTVDQNGEAIVQVDDLKTVMITGEKDLKRCRYCGNSRGTLSCAKCSRKYCSKECQVKDWKNFKHNLICELAK